MWRLMNFLMLSCKRASELIEKKVLFGLNPVQSIQLKLHTTMCWACTTYQKQSGKLDESLEIFIQTRQDINTSHISVSKELKKKIIQRLENN